MVNRRKTNVGGRNTPGNEIQSLVNGLARGIQLGIVVFPKALTLYRNAIYCAFDGDFTLLEQSLKGLEEHHKNVGKMDSTVIHLDRWKAGMKDSYEGQLYVLRMYHQILREYWSNVNGTPNTVSKITNQDGRRATHCLAGISRQTVKYDLKRNQRHEL